MVPMYKITDQPDMLNMPPWKLSPWSQSTHKLPVILTYNSTVLKLNAQVGIFYRDFPIML